MQLFLTSPSKHSLRLFLKLEASVRRITNKKVVPPEGPEGEKEKFVRVRHT